MRHNIRFALALAFSACYSPAVPNGQQECGPKGECVEGYFCAADHRCYKKGSGPTADMAPPRDMVMQCTPDLCANSPKPVCDPDSHACVDCLVDGDCPAGKVCQQKACVDGCTDQHPCPSGMCVNGKCTVCKADADCLGEPMNKKCDLGSGKCVRCLVTPDCAQGEFCDPADHGCHQGCDDDSQCKPTSDGGGQLMKCCNHGCYDVNSDQAHCGDCGTDCQGDTCCAGFCSDTTNDLSNCGGCGRACAGMHANWTCAQSTCAVVSCMGGFNDCNGQPGDGCESAAASDVNNCGGCGKKCMANNASVTCVNGGCMVGACNMGFGDCNMQPGDGCEVNTNDDIKNCGTCGKTCAPLNASPACVGGGCSFGACNGGFSNCDGNQVNGCETSTASDPMNCGGCNVKCAGLPNVMTVSCVNSMCAIGACNPGFRDCNGIAADGCEVNLNTDVNNCGGCLRACSGANVAAKACVGGLCTSTCVGGFGNCVKPVAPGADDGCETSTSNDKNNCGACGVICGLNLSCVNSMCVAAKDKVLIAAAEQDASLTALKAKLDALGVFATVDVMNVQNVTPTVAQLQQYNVVLTWSDFGGGLDEKTFMDNLATYFDGGGRVVVAMFKLGGYPNGWKGRFDNPANPYMFFNIGVASNYDNAGNQTLGAVPEPGSPLMVGVVNPTITGWTTKCPLINGAVVTAFWSGGRPFIVRGVVNGRKRADINLWPDPGQWGGDTINAIRNALQYQ